MILIFQRALACMAPLFLFVACSTDFSLEAEGRDIPIIYGSLSIADTAHYVRVERAFLEAGADARAIAQNPDAIYYSTEGASVRLHNLRTGAMVVLERVDGTAEGLSRQEGPFARQPNILYKADPAALRLQGGDEVRISVERPGATSPAVAQTTMLGALVPIETRPTDPARIADYQRDLIISWTAGPEARVFDIRLVFHYREFFTNDPSRVEERQLSWDLVKGLIRPDENQLVSYSISNEQFFQFLGTAIAPQPDVVRVLDGFDIIIAGAGEEVADYLQIANANFGLTGSQQIPVYTNVDEGRGIFTSRFVARRNDIDLDNTGLDTLRRGRYTRNLSFQ